MVHFLFIPYIFSPGVQISRFTNASIKIAFSRKKTDKRQKLEVTKKKSTCIADSFQQFVQRFQLLLIQLLFRKDQSPLIALFTLEHGVCVFCMLYGWRKFKFFSFVCRAYGQTWETLKHRNRKKYYNIIFARWIQSQVNPSQQITTLFYSKGPTVEKVSKLSSFKTF